MRVWRWPCILAPWIESQRHSRRSSVSSRYSRLAWLALPAGASAAEPIKIGAVLPFSGGVELYGQQAKLGLDLAAKEINAAGGILGRPVEIIYADDKTDPTSAVEATERLVTQDGVSALVGPITSRNLDAMAPVVERLKTPLLYATNYEGGKCGRYIFSFSTVPNQELAPLLPYMTRTFGKSYFLLGADRLWPHKMFEVAEPIIQQARRHASSAPNTPPARKPISRRSSPRSPPPRPRSCCSRLKGDGLNFIPQAADRGLLEDHHRRVSRIVRDRPRPVRRQGPEHVRGGAVRRHQQPAGGQGVCRQGSKRSAGAGVPVSNYVLTHYNTLIATKAAIEKTGKADKEAIIDGLEGLTIKSPTGPVTIEKNHHAAMNMFLAKTKGRDLVTVQALGMIKPEPRCN